MITRDLLVSGGLNNGYVPKLKSAVVQPVFAGANIAVRREALQEVGEFDGEMGTREDADLSLRFANSRWHTFHDERAIVQHRFRATFRELLRQWYNYGRYHAHVLAKHTQPGLEILAPTGGGRAMVTMCLPFPLRAFIPLTLFHMFHGALGTTILALWAHNRSLAMASALLTAWIGVKHFLLPFPQSNRRSWLLFLLMRYATNWAFVLGGLLGGFTVGMLNLEPTHDRNGLPD
jgi:cellulose synthase/poly-beta-1,6-N-acetylglucosamine synthase-like glycosyltransferase